MFISQVAAATHLIDRHFLFSHNITDYLAPFKEVALFNLRRAAEASIFLIGEQHNDPRCLQMQADLIQFLASQGSVIVLIEGMESGLIEDSAQFCQTALGMKIECHLQNISIMGWDVSRGLFKSGGHLEADLEMIFKRIANIESDACALLQKLIYEWPIFTEIILDTLNDLSFDDLQDAFGSTENLCETQLNIIQSFLEMREANKNRALKLLQGVINWVPQAIVNNLCQTTIHQKLRTDIWSGRCGCVDSEILKGINDLLNLLRELDDSKIEFQEGEKHPITAESVEKIFPMRTASMVSSLQQLAGIKLCMGEMNARVVVIAGADHLKTPEYAASNSNLDLSSLYEELHSGGHEAAILIPQHVLDLQH